MKTNANSPANRIHLSRLARACALALITCVSGFAAAADFGDRTPSITELVDALNAKPYDSGDDANHARPGGVRTRGLKLVGQRDSDSDVSAPAAKAPASATGRVSMRIQFDLNSDRVSSASANSLGNLAAALNSPALKDRRFEILGHADVSGSYRYNVNLSSRRAHTVAEFLSIAGVEPARAKASGLGPSQLLQSVPASAPQQRRVEIVMLD